VGVHSRGLPASSVTWQLPADAGRQQQVTLCAQALGVSLLRSSKTVNQLSLVLQASASRQTWTHQSAPVSRWSSSRRAAGSNNNNHYYHRLAEKVQAWYSRAWHIALAHTRVATHQLLPLYLSDQLAFGAPVLLAECVLGLKGCWAPCTPSFDGASSRKHGQVALWVLACSVLCCTASCIQ